MKPPEIRFPLRLLIKEEIGHKGKVVILGREVNGTYLVDFAIEGFEIDRSVMTAGQVESWTGWREDR